MTLLSRSKKFDEVFRRCTGSCGPSHIAVEFDIEVIGERLSITAIAN